MSWDVVLCRLPEGVGSFDDVAVDFRPGPLGSRANVRSVLHTMVPGVDFSEPHRGTVAAEGWSMVVRLGARDPVEAVVLFIRGAHAAALVRVLALAVALECRVVDCSSGEVIADDSAGSGPDFQEFRDRVTGGV